MRELSLNVMDVAQNSVRAEASLVTITVDESDKNDRLTISIEDNGCGMTEEQVQQVIDPFFTTRTTRKVGLGVPLFKMSAEQTGGSFSIKSEPGKGTVTTASYVKSHVDMTPLGDINSTVEILIRCNPDIDFVFIHSTDNGSFTLDTRELREVLDGVSLDTPDVLDWIHAFLESLAELQAIRDKARANVNLRKENPNAAKVLVGMATCGIAAGARPVLNAFVEEIAKRGLSDDIVVTQTGCIGICQYEPVVEVEIPGQEKVTYVKMSPEKAVEVVNDHLVNKNVVSKYTIGAYAE